jgi:hypothetical protein
MKTLFITISRGSLIRNFFQTGIISKILEKGIKVVVLTPQHKEREIFAKYTHKNLFFEPLIVGKVSFLDTVLMEFGKGVIYGKTVLTRYRYRFAGKSPNKILYFPRVFFFFFFRFFPSIKTIIRKIGLTFFPQKQHDYLFKKYNPDLLFVTDYMDIADVSVMKSAKRFGVKSAGMPKSWDNLSKNLFRVKSDKIFVWGEFGKIEAVKYQDFKEKDVVVAGVPQFDFYKNENVMSRGDFCESLGLDKEKEIIFYGSTGPHCDNEFEYVDLLLEFIEKEKTDAQILIRPHLAYVDDDKKFEKFKNNANVVIYKNKQNLELRDRWDLSDDHLKYLFNSIYHAEVSINIASTLTLDSLAIGTPVINIDFDTKKKDTNDSVHRFYKTNYTGTVTKFGGTWLTKSREEFSENLKKILIDNENRRDIRKKMIHFFLNKNDNHAGDRVVENIVKFINQ